MAAVLARAAREFDAQADPRRALQAVVDLAQESLDGVDEVGVSMVDSSGVAEVLAASGPLVWQLHVVKSSLGQAPCLDVVHPESPRTIVVNRIRDEQRWSRYVRRAVQLGLKAQVTVGLVRGDQVKGALSLYSTGTEELDPEVCQVAEAFGELAAMAL